MVADCYCWSLLGLRVFGSDDSKGDVGKGKVAVLGDREPGFERCHCESSDCDGKGYVSGVKLEGRTRECTEHVEVVFADLDGNSEAIKKLQERQSQGVEKGGASKEGLMRPNSALSPCPQLTIKWQLRPTLIASAYALINLLDPNRGAE